MSRDFDLGDIPSITTGALVSPRHIDGVYDILDYPLQKLAELTETPDRIVVVEVPS